jgi:hypothetical protein
MKIDCNRVVTALNDDVALISRCCLVNRLGVGLDVGLDVGLGIGLGDAEAIVAQLQQVITQRRASTGLHKNWFTRYRFAKKELPFDRLFFTLDLDVVLLTI